MADIERRLRRARYINALFPMDRIVFRDRANPLETLSPLEDRERYRVFLQTILFLVNMLNLERATERSCSLPPLISTLAALHFLATGTHHIVTAGLHVLSRSSVCRAVSEFTDSVCRHLNDFVFFSNIENVQWTVQKQFYNIAGAY
ncbi:hypothetical protein DPMN_012700 [Dreissena polymorpha]|uniref:Nuclease HARBI1 n=1 Tax=Dreissena polymorpha TaxID=45954 RepID=A0A9D4S1N4_DREPO|nr:hypothetical protein DPMN_012700 [Dreissena polymorpha]